LRFSRHVLPNEARPLKIAHGSDALCRDAQLSRTPPSDRRVCGAAPLSLGRLRLLADARSVPVDRASVQRWPSARGPPFRAAPPCPPRHRDPSRGPARRDKSPPPGPATAPVRQRPHKHRGHAHVAESPAPGEVWRVVHGGAGAYRSPLRSPGARAAASRRPAPRHPAPPRATAPRPGLPPPGATARHRPTPRPALAAPPVLNARNRLVADPLSPDKHLRRLPRKVDAPELGCDRVTITVRRRASMS